MNHHLPFVCAVLFGAISSAQDAGPVDAAAPRRAVLVTGASSGIGRTTAELLAANGFFVYAGARKQQDLEALDALEHVQALRLDVTVQADIDAAVATVRDAGRGLFGLINNAGVLVVGPLIELREQDLAFQLDVNVYGPYRVTKAFAPLLIASKGRVLTTGSLSGTVCWPMGGAYCISKHAVDAFTDVLAAELRPFDVGVGVVEPGNFRSEIMTNMKERLAAAGYTTEGSLYRERLDSMLERPAGRDEYPAPDAVAQAFLAALTAEETPRRRLVVPNRREAEVTVRAAIARLVELSVGHEFALDREQLVAMLDEELQRQRAAAGADGTERAR